MDDGGNSMDSGNMDICNLTFNSACYRAASVLHRFSALA